MAPVAAGAAAAADAGVAVVERHRVGLGWRPELAASICLHLDRIDVVEVIADNYFHASRREREALRGLSRDVPLHLHGVGMGLASASPVDEQRLAQMARLIDEVQPAGWSEHLAFVRAGGIEIGHLAMPPRTPRTVEQSVHNIERARAVTGMNPRLENIATLFDPPTSTLKESEWTREILAASGARRLLDLHNLYANAVNAGRDPETDLLEFPLASVESLHLSGGRWVQSQTGAQRLLDDHVHSPPPEVFQLLRLLREKTSQSLDVILERDGHYPAFDLLLAELDGARAALQSVAPRAQPGRRSHA